MIQVFVVVSLSLERYYFPLFINSIWMKYQMDTKGSSNYCKKILALLLNGDLGQSILNY